VSELECLPLGIGQNDRGVCLQVRLGPYWVLLDCGLKDLSSLLASKQTPWSALLCTHAHPDHSSGLQELHAALPELPIFTSEVTARLLPLNWTDTKSEAEFCHPLPWRTQIQIQPNLSATLLPSGHLPGAASIWLSYAAADRDYTVLFIGDFYLSNSRLVEGLPLDEFRHLCPDVLIVEGSFGTAHHPHRRGQENRLAIAIKKAIASGKTVIIPVPKLGLAQEILMLLRSHHHFTGQDLDIWVDREIAKVCDRYLDLLPYLPRSIQNFAQHQSLFWDDRIKPRVRRWLDEQNIDRLNPSILLVDEDSNWRDRLKNSTNNWLVVLLETNEREAIGFNSSDRISFETFLLAEHSDVSGTTQLIHNLKPQHVVFIHGRSDYLSDLANLDELRNRYHIHCPAVGMRLELPVNDALHLAAQPRDSSDRQTSPYEGELAELESEIMLTLPGEITADPRWLSFADTGLIEARWQGEELVVRGISQRELLLVDTHSYNSSLISCGNCRYYRTFRCTNPESPLHNFKVSSDGSCPAFAAHPP
jgi:Cft2 family RNA processing exonuclease